MTWAAMPPADLVFFGTLAVGFVAGYVVRSMEARWKC